LFVLILLPGRIKSTTKVLQNNLLAPQYSLAMISFFRLLLLVYTLVRLTIAVSLTEEGAYPTTTWADSIPLPPSKDPFYSTPQGYKNTAPGTVLRVRNAPEFAKGIANCSAAYNILYRTTDSNSAPTWAVTTLLVPEHIPRNSTSNGTTVSPGSVLLSYQVSC
jgi:hypothetical protein